MLPEITIDYLESSLTKAYLEPYQISGTKYSNVDQVKLVEDSL